MGELSPRDRPGAVARPPRLSIAEVFGLSPLPVRLREALLAVRGDENVPPSRVDLTSLRVLMPVLSVKTWLGLRRPDRRIPVYNLFNHTPTPPGEGWSVRKTQVRDFRGGTLTYDSHNGTDFVIPTGTVVVAPAPGVVLRVSSELNRGGLKVFIDHGEGLVTTSNHLGRALVAPGDHVRRGDPIALSGYSGLDGLVFFPWSVPHVHFNVWLDGEYVDPFPVAGEPSLWRDGDDPRPSAEPADGEPFTPTAWDGALVERAIAAAKDAVLRRALLELTSPGERALAVMFQRNYYPTRFDARPPLYSTRHPRAPRLTLPFRASDFVGLAL